MMFMYNPNGGDKKYSRAVIATKRSGSLATDLPLIFPTVVHKSKSDNGITYIQPFMPYTDGICTYYDTVYPSGYKVNIAANGSTTVNDAVVYRNSNEYVISYFVNGTNKVQGKDYSSWDSRLTRASVKVKAMTGGADIFTTTGLCIELPTSQNYTYASNMAVIRCKNCRPTRTLSGDMYNNSIFYASMSGFSDSFSKIGSLDGYDYYCCGNVNNNPSYYGGTSGFRVYFPRTLITVERVNTSQSAECGLCYYENSLIRLHQPIEAY